MDIASGEGYGCGRLGREILGGPSASSASMSVMSEKRGMIVVDGGETGRPYCQVVAGARVELRVDVPNRGLVRWTFLSKPPGSVAVFENEAARATAFQTVAGDIANMYVVRLDVDGGKDQSSYDCVVLGMPDVRGWVIPSYPVASAGGEVEPGFEEQPVTDPWNVEWGMRWILNSIRTALGSVATLIRVDGADVGSRPAVNFIAGDGIELEGADDGVGGEVEVVITATGGSDVLWRWDGVGTDQFGSPLGVPDWLGGAGPLGTATLTVVVGEDGNHLKMAVAGTSQTGMTFWPLAAGQVSLPPRFIVEMGFAVHTPDDGNNYAGCAFYTTGEVVLASLFGITHLQNTQGSSWQGVINAGVYCDAAGGTMGASISPCRTEIEVVGRKPANDQPRGRTVHWSSGGVSGANTKAGGERWNDASYFTVPGGGNNWPAGWDGLDADDLGQFGLVLFLNAPIDNPVVELSYLQIVRHPADR